MDTYTVSLFGHREIENPTVIAERLRNIVRNLIQQKPYVEFLVGRDGDFDLLAASVVRRTAAATGFGNTALTLVLPYMRAEFRDNEQSFLDYYDTVEICAESAAAHRKAAIQLRNRSMIDRSDLVLCCIQHSSGGAYQAVRYAQQRCSVVNLAAES